VLHRLDGGGTWDLVPVMQPEDDYRFEDYDGFALVITPRNQSGTAPWFTVTDLAAPPNPKMILINQGPDDVTIRHNTILNPPGHGSSYLLFANATHKKGNAFAFTDNIVPLGTYGLRAENPSLGSSSLTLLDGHFCGWVLSRNILINPHGNPPSTYPAGQYWVSSLAAVGFQDLSRETSR
jgi:hypothetical protein